MGNEARVRNHHEASSHVVGRKMSVNQRTSKSSKVQAKPETRFQKAVRLYSAIEKTATLGVQTDDTECRCGTP